MRSRLPLIIIAVLGAVAALTVAIVAVAGADKDADLRPLTAAELLSRMTVRGEEAVSISGDLAWTNQLFGEVPTFGDEDFADAMQAPLLGDGSGRLWAAEGRVRCDAYTDAGDQVFVADGAAGTGWVYDGARDAATLYELDEEPGGAADADGEQEPALRSPEPEPPTPERVAEMLAAAARFMAVEVTGTSVVAGRDAYLLTMTPVATDTALGSVQAAIDGHTFVPLRVAVTARGADEAVLSFGFERVSYAGVDNDVFAFSPPATAEVTRETIDLGDGRCGDDAGAVDEADAAATGHDEGAGRQGAGAAHEEAARAARRAVLGLEQARALVDFDLHAAEGYTARAFRWAYVFDDGLPLDAAGSPVLAGLKAVTGGAAEDGESASDTRAASEAAEVDGDVAGPAGPAAVLLYGEGFGAIALAQTRTTPELRECLQQLPALFEPGSAAAGSARSLLTPLGGAVVWEDGGVTLVASGIVPPQDLLEFVGTVR